MKLEGLKQEELVNELETAENKSAKIVETVQTLVNESNKEIIERYQAEFAEYNSSKQDNAKFGLRTLNNEEKSFIGKIVQAGTTGVFTTNNQDEVIPTTITNYVFEDLRQNHDLLKHVQIVPAGVQKWVLAEYAGNAGWGKLYAAVTEEITAELETINLDAHKLSAFTFIPKAILDLGDAWVEKYVREILAEVMEDGLEQGIVAGDGQESPIGLVRKLSGATDGVYPKRNAAKIDDFTVESLGQHFVTLTDNGKRNVGKVLLIVNPADAYTKVAEAATMLTATGDHKQVFPYDIEVVNSTHVTIGEAILYLPNKYTVGVQELALAMSDEFKFLDDVRTYKVVTYGNGRLAKENQAVLLDISEVKPVAFPVRQVEDIGA